MKTLYTLRFATATDAAAMLEIYTPYIKGTPVTFELELPSLTEFTARVATISATFPWLVMEFNGKLIGYTYASRYRDRIAYQWSVECSIYVMESFQGKGIAQALYFMLFELLKLQGFANVYAIITTPNLQSEKFHASFGFTTIGVFKEVGFKLNKWHDVKWMGLKLNDYTSTPLPPLTIKSIISDTTNLEQLENKALTYIK